MNAKQRKQMRIIGIVLSVLLALSMAACGGGSAAPVTQAQTTTAAPTTAAPTTAAPTTTQAPTTATTTTQAPTTAAPTTAAPTTAAPAGPKTQLTVFAAASLTESMEEIATLYAKVAPDVEIVYNFDSSGTLKTQIEEGAECDLFISAGAKQVNELDISKDTETNPDQLDFVLQGTRVNLLENQVVLVVPETNPKGLSTFDDLAKILSDGEVLLAMGNSDVPVGQYTQRILTFYSLNEEELANAGKISYGSNVKEVVTQVTEASVDAGVVYCTDAFSAGLEIMDSATAEMCGQVIYPAAVMKETKNADAAKAFLAYLADSEAMSAFEKVGFVAVK